MSGGSWDYCYHTIQDAADKMIRSRDRLRRTFWAHLNLVAKAMHDIEWVDSDDYGPGDEVKAIEAVLGKKAKVLELKEANREAKELIKVLTDLTKSNDIGEEK